MRKIGIAVVVGLMAATLGGCASVKQTYSADGRKAYALNCSGLARGWDKCLAKAGQICGTRGYEIVDRNSETAAAISGTTAGFSGAQTKERTMMITCKG
jgi:hypothetical protein